MHQHFNIRVYGILLQDDHVLISHERIAGKAYAKFPGGGLEFGEGPKDAVVREFMEELAVEVQVISHFYTTDFYLPSAFDPRDQVLSVYYCVSALGETEFPFHLPPPTEQDVLRDKQVFRWHSIDALDVTMFELPADRVVAKLLSGSPAE